MYAIMKNTQIFIECDFFSQTELMSDRNSGGMCDPLIDLAMFAIYSYYTEEELENLIKIYLKREPSKEEQNFLLFCSKFFHNDTYK